MPQLQVKKSLVIDEFLDAGNAYVTGNMRNKLEEAAVELPIDTNAPATITTILLQNKAYLQKEGGDPTKVFDLTVQLVPTKEEKEKEEIIEKKLMTFSYNLSQDDDQLTAQVEEFKKTFSIPELTPVK